ncbi:BET1 homolog [Uranotaenia lowii]|uniref:BET1 homolog n=1 Tax=Uranotaenia lowii TaxID=190385 RepID=UPI00247901EB|nr:BET1 homolog [Uranotaenia lowii]XP_055598733.1 BET1 homolog [Uranotaenia lowii]
MRRSQGYAYQPLAQNPGPSGNHSHDALEEENERLADDLKNKIGALKSLTIDIGNEVRYQDKLLRGIDEDMDRTGGFLSNTITRVVRLGKGGHRNYMCYMFLFVMFVFFILFLIMKLR